MNNYYQKNMGNTIKILRLFHGIKQKHLAEQLNIKASLLSLYEQGKREPTIRFLKKFCIFNEITLSEFFKLVENQDFNDKPQVESKNNYSKQINKLMENVGKVLTPVSS